MLNTSIEVTDRIGKIKEAVKEIRKMEVLVGIPESENVERGSVTNAQLLFIHTNGSPINKIPARPVIEPAIEADKEVITGILKEAIKFAFEGDLDSAKRKLEEAGLEGQAASQDWFDNPANGWAPNSLKVQKRKLAKGSTDPKPLIDTGELRKSITYVVRRK